MSYADLMERIARDIRDYRPHSLAWLELVVADVRGVRRARVLEEPYRVHVWVFLPWWSRLTLGLHARLVRRRVEEFLRRELPAGVVFLLYLV